MLSRHELLLNYPFLDWIHITLDLFSFIHSNNFYWTLAKCWGHSEYQNGRISWPYRDEWMSIFISLTMWAIPQIPPWTTKSCLFTILLSPWWICPLTHFAMIIWEKEGCEQVTILFGWKSLLMPRLKILCCMKCCMREVDSGTHVVVGQ